MKSKLLMIALMTVVANGWANEVPTVTASPAHHHNKKARPKLVKVTLPPAIALPGVMKIEGADVAATDFSRSRVVPFVNGSSRTLHVSATEPNLIQLPFTPTNAPATERLTIQNSGNNLFVSFDPRFANDDKPAQLWIEAPNHQVMGLQLVPGNMPAQPILLESRATYDGNARTRKGVDSYVAGIQDIMQELALGQAPEGCTVIDLTRSIGQSPIAMNGLLVSAQKEYSCDSNNLFVYQVSNPGDKRVMVREDEFDGKLVTAISIYPRPLLNAGDLTQVFVLVDKETAR